MQNKDYREIEKNIDHLLWKSGDKKRLFDCPIFSVNSVVRESQDGRKGTFIEVECPKWVVIIPVFQDEKGSWRVIMEEQYRHGSDSITLEYPAGLVEEGEDPLDAARRELLEETGYEAGDVKLLADMCPNNAFMSNRQYYYLAKNLHKVGDQNLDANEQIDVFSLPLEEVIENMGSGIADNAIMMAATGLLIREFRRREGKEETRK